MAGADPPAPAPGASHSELAEMMEVEKATAGRMIDRLVANGWVERRTAERRPPRQARLSHGGSRAGAQAHLARRRSDGRRCARRSFRAGKQAADALLQRVKKNLVSADGAVARTVRPRAFRAMPTGGERPQRQGAP
jgi:MarR family transcriptional regulator for hemolysin